MNKDIIKRNNISDKVSKTREETNSQQIEESQKKAVNKGNSSTKAIKNEDSEPHITMRDYSGKIKYNKRNKAAENNSDIIKNNTKNDIVKNKDNSVVRNTENVSEIIKNGENRGIIKNGSRVENAETFKEIKSESTVKFDGQNIKVDNNISKPFKYKTSADVNIRKTDNLDSIKQFDKSVIKDNGRSVVNQGNNGNLSKRNKAKKFYKRKNAYSYKDNTAVSAEKPKNVIIDEKMLEIDVLPQEHTSAVSYTAKEYLSDNADKKENKRSKLSETAHKKAVEKISDNAKAFQNQKTTDYSNIVIEERPQTFNYAEEISKTAQAVKKEFSYNDVVKTDNNISFGNSGKSADKSSKRHSQKGKISDKENIFSYGGAAVKNSIQDKAESSEDNGIKATAITVGVAETAVEILKPEDTKHKITKGDKRKTVYNKSKTSKTAENLSIKAELKNQLTSGVLYAENTSSKLLKKGGDAVLKSIKDGISETAENDLAFKAVDDVINTVDTAKNIAKGTKATVNTGKTVAKSFVNTGKAIKNAPKNVKVVARTFKEKVRKIQKVRVMKAAAKKKFAKKAFKDTAKILLNAAKGAAVKFIAIILALVILIIAICGAVVGAIGSFIWQTSSDLDTTMIIKHIAGLDYNRQNAWYKGKTGIEIYEYNDTHDSRSIAYHYLLAVDVPPEYTADGIVSTGAVECMVTVGMNGDGTTKRPSYSGFNNEFSSCDEMLEECQWTTEDYRAALAYMQVKNENLGWFATLIGFVGEYQLKQSAEKLHKATYEQPIVIRTVEPEKDDKYEFYNGIYNTSYSKDGSSDYYYFGRKFSVQYLIENDMVRFDDDEDKNKSMKERYEYVYKYGNFAVGNLEFPLELADGEKISDRIAKHFGKQLSLEYEPPEPDDDGEPVYGKVKKKATYHYANDLSADKGDVIYCPIGGLCKVVQREKRGFEFLICTSYNGNEFDFTKDGCLIKISCASTSFIPLSTPTVVSKGAWLGKVADNPEVNYKVPETDNDIENEDIFADKLFPCSTLTAYHDIGRNKYEVPKPEQNHIHIEMYKLPCDFTNKADIEKNVLAPELFFDYSKEVED